MFWHPKTILLVKFWDALTKKHHLATKKIIIQFRLDLDIRALIFAGQKFEILEQSGIQTIAVVDISFNS